MLTVYVHHYQLKNRRNFPTLIIFPPQLNACANAVMLRKHTYIQKPAFPYIQKLYF